jgi:hypothetical protein
MKRTQPRRVRAAPPARVPRDVDARVTRTSGAVGIALAASLITGCATTRYQTVYCISHDTQLPSEPPKVHSQLTGHADSDIGIIAGSAIRLRAWGEGLQTILEGCRAPTK